METWMTNLPDAVRVCSLLVLGAALTIAPAAAAQAQTSATPPQPNTVTELTSAPAPGQHAISLTAAAQLKDGRTEARGIAVDGWAAYTSRRNQMWRFDVALARNETKSSPTAQRQVIEDNHELSLTFTHPLRGRLDLLTRGVWKRDAPLKLDHRVLGVAGLAVHAMKTRAAQLTIAPVLAAGRQRSQLAHARTAILDIGLLQTLTWHLSPTFALQNAFDIFRDIDNGGDRSAALDLSGTATIAKHVGLKVTYKYTHDTIHPPSVSASQKELGAGVTVTFRGK
jgi:hypothetical protein